MTDSAPPNFNDVFETNRPRLIGLAYRMTGQVSEAEDTVQDAWIRWQAVDHCTIESPSAYLTRVVTRLCIDRSSSARARREVYVGQWLPEPLLSIDTDEPSANLEMAQDVSVALMLVLQRCSPSERAALLLHDVLDQSFEEIAKTLNRTPQACRKLASRARTRVRADHQRHAIDAADSQRFAKAFLTAIQSGDLETMSQMLAEQAVLTTDGGGKKSSALLPIIGREKIIRFFVGIVSKSGPPRSIELRDINGEPGFLVVEQDGGLQTWSLDWTALGEVVEIYLVRNPDKLAHIPNQL